MKRHLFLLISTLLLTLTTTAQTAFRHVTTATNTNGHITTLDHPQLNGNPNAILQVTADFRNVYNASNVGVWYNGTKWTIYNQDKKVMSNQGLQFNVMIVTSGENHFIHVATADNIGKPHAYATTINHPQLNNNPSAIVLVTQNYGANNIYNTSEIAVWYTGQYWNIYNENQSKMPVGASFNVSIITPPAESSVHLTSTSNIWGQVNSATETAYADPQKLLFITHNGNQSDWNPNPCGIYYPPGRTKWSILTGNTAPMPVRVRFNIVAMSLSPATENPLASVNVELFHPNSSNREVQEITTTLPFHTAPQQITVEVVDGYVIYQGDIILGREDAFFERQNGRLIPRTDDGVIQKDAGRPGDQFRWANGIVPFEIQANHPRQAQIREAIRLFNGSTNICFRPRTDETDFVAFVMGDGCSSPVGTDPRARDARTGAFNIIIGNLCSVGNIQHEMLHTAGMYHEQSRSDRDNFVRINTQNILPGRENNFRREAVTISTCQYDFGSIMHYPATAFSSNGQPTIEPIRPLPAGVTMGQRVGLSDCDIRGVNALYPTATGCGTTGGSTGGSAVIAYELPNFRGRSVSFSNVGEFRSSGFRIQSIRVPNGFWVALMDHAECLVEYFLVARDVPDMSAQYISCGALLATPQSTPSRNFEVTIRTGEDGIRSGSQAFAEILLRNGSTQRFPLNNGATWADNSTHTISIRLPDNVQIRDIQTFTVRFESTGNDWNADNWKLDFLQFRYLSDQVSYPINLVRWAGTPAFEFQKNANRSKSTLINPY